MYHHYEKWEDFKSGMWRKETKAYGERELPNVIEFTGNHILYGNAMLRVVTEWKISCEHNLSNASINRKAWIGHAACCIEKGYPEYLVRVAWGLLTEQQRVDANKRADYAIQKWVADFNEKKSNTIQLSLWSSVSDHILNFGKTGVIKTEYQTKRMTG